MTWMHFFQTWNLLDFKICEFEGLELVALKNGLYFNFSGEWSGHPLQSWSILQLIDEQQADPAHIKAHIKGLIINGKNYPRIIFDPQNETVGQCRCDHYRGLATCSSPDNTRLLRYTSRQ
jgi:hypothetical protein